MIKKKKLTQEQERTALLFYLCGVQKPYLTSNIDLPPNFIWSEIFLERSKEWNDPLVEFYKNGDTFKNASHIYLVFNNFSIGLPDVKLIDKKRDLKVYRAVEGEIFEPMIREAYIDTRLSRIFEASHKTLESEFLRNLFNREGTKWKETEKKGKDIIKQILLKRLNIDYGDREKIRMRSFHLSSDIYRYMGEALSMMRDQDVWRYWVKKKEKLNRNFKYNFKDSIDKLTKKEKEIIGLIYGFIQREDFNNLEDIGRIYGISLEQIKKIESNAFHKLRKGIRIKNLEEFIYKDPFSYSEIKLAEESEEIKAKSISEFSLSSRSMNILKKMGIKTLGDLTLITENEIRSRRPIGDKTFYEIKDLLSSYSLRFKRDICYPLR